MSSLGIRAESGGSAMSRVILNMNDAVMDGGEQLGKYAKVAGMSGKEFQKAFKDDAAGALAVFIKGLSKTQKSGGNVNAVLEDMGLNEIRVKDALLRLAGSQGILTEALDTGRYAWKKNNALQEETAVRYADFANQLKIMKNRLMSVVLIIGKPMLEVLSGLLGALDPVMSAIEKLADKFDGLSDKTKRTVAAFVLAIPVVFGLFAAIFAGIAGFTLLASVTTASGTSVLLLSAKITLLIATVVTIVAVIVKATIAIVKNWDKIGDAVKKVWEIFKSFGSYIAGAFSSAFESLKGVLESVGNTFASLGSSISK